MTTWYLFAQPVRACSEQCGRVERNVAYPVDVNSFRREGTDGSHHFQSLGFRAKLFPDAVEIKVESCIC